MKKSGKQDKINAYVVARQAFAEKERQFDQTVQELRDRAKSSDGLAARRLEEAKKLKFELKEKAKQFDESKARLVAVNEDLERKLEELEKANNDERLNLEEQLKEMKSSKYASDEKKRAMLKQLKKEQEISKVSVSEKSKLLTVVDSLNKKLEESRKLQGTFERKYRTMKTKEEEAQKTISTMGQEFETLKSKISTFKEQNLELQEKVTALDVKLQAKNEETKVRKNQESNAFEECVQLKSDLLNRENENQRLKELECKLQEKVDDQVALNHLLQEQCTSLQTRADELTLLLEAKTATPPQTSSSELELIKEALIKRGISIDFLLSAVSRQENNDATAKRESRVTSTGVCSNKPAVQCIQQSDPREEIDFPTTQPLESGDPYDTESEADSTPDAQDDTIDEASIGKSKRCVEKIHLPQIAHTKSECLESQSLPSSSAKKKTGETLQGNNSPRPLTTGNQNETEIVSQSAAFRKMRKETKNRISKQNFNRRKKEKRVSAEEIQRRKERLEKTRKSRLLSKPAPKPAASHLESKLFLGGRVEDFISAAPANEISKLLYQGRI